MVSCLNTKSIRLAS